MVCAAAKPTIKEMIKKMPRLAKFYPIRRAVHAADSLTHSCHAVHKRQQRINRLEKFRCDFNRKRTAGAGNLNNQQNDTDCLADVSERDGQRVNDIDIDDAGEPARQQEQKRMLALNAQIPQVACGNQCALHETDDEKDDISSQIYLMRLDAPHAVQTFFGHRLP